MSQALLEKETLTRVEIQDIVKNVATSKSSGDVGSSGTGGTSLAKESDPEEEQDPSPLAALGLVVEKEAELVPVEAGNGSHR